MALVCGRDVQDVYGVEQLPIGFKASIEGAILAITNQYNEFASGSNKMDHRACNKEVQIYKKTGKALLQSLKDKHPPPRRPDSAAFLQCDILPTE